MEYRVKVQFETPVAAKFQDRNVFRIRGTIVDAENVPFEVFLHKKTLVNPDTLQQLDDFVAVCGPYDLATFPALVPQVGIDPPFFRKSSFDILVPGVGAADTVQKAITEQLCLLCTLMKKMDDLGIIQVLWVCSDPLPPAPTTTTTTTSTTTTLP